MHHVASCLVQICVKVFCFSATAVCVHNVPKGTAHNFWRRHFCIVFICLVFSDREIPVVERLSHAGLLAVGGEFIFEIGPTHCQV